MTFPWLLATASCSVPTESDQELPEKDAAIDTSEIDSAVTADSGVDSGDPPDTAEEEDCADWSGPSVETARNRLVGFNGVTFPFLASMAGGTLAFGAGEDEYVFLWQGPVDGERAITEGSRMLTPTEDRWSGSDFGASLAAVGGEGALLVSSNDRADLYAPGAATPALSFVPQELDRVTDCCFGLASGDLTGDGIDDAVIGGVYGDLDYEWREPGAVVVFDATRSGTFDEGDADAILTGEDRSMVGTAVTALRDTDGDGFDDLVIPLGHLYVFRGPLAGTASVLSDADLMLGAAAADSASAGDWDGDGLVDVALNDGEWPGALAVHSLTGPDESASPLATFVSSESHFLSSPSGWEQRTVPAADIDGDGRPDLHTGLVAGECWSIMFLSGGVAGTQVVGNESGVRIDGGSGWGVAVTDLDEDGGMEVAYAGIVEGQTEFDHAGAVAVFAASDLLAGTP